MIEAGTRLGPYEILSRLGAGGMGEVWRARDTRLERDVAIKVLPQHLAATPEARARLEREARTISGLNHPHICTLHDVGHEGDVDFLVMELIEGETLTDRLQKGPIPLDEMLRIAIEVAGALDVAHRQGIVHRDLKPGNIMLTRAGAKLMDFGLARAVSTREPADPASSLTISQSLTTEGTLVGTFVYMSPEQLEGKEADARSDIWALGCVLYEMATGRRPFAGQSQASLIGSIMQSQPPSLVDAAPLTPPALERVVTACMAKDAEERIQTAHDVRLQLQWVAEGGSLAGVPVPVAQRRRQREHLAWVLVALLGLAAAWGAYATLTRPDTPPVVTRFSVTSPPGTRSANWPRISPDGRHLAFLAIDSTGTQMIWLRSRDALTAQPLSGTEGAGRPFWSPDSRYVAYFEGDQLRKAAIAGGPPQLICQTESAADGVWGAADVILFDGAAGDSIRQVSALGGVAAAATTLDRAAGHAQHAWPCFLPDGRHFLYMSMAGGAENGMRLNVGDLQGDFAADLGPISSRVEFAPPDLVLYAAETTLMARRLDLGKWRWRSDPFPIAEGVRISGNGHANFSVSNNGVLVTMNGTGSGVGQLVWVDRRGRRIGEPEGPPADYRNLDLSADDRLLAYSLGDERTGSSNIWIRDLARSVSSRLTFGDRSEQIFPRFSPDGARIAYSSNATTAFSIWTVPTDGTTSPDSVFVRDFHAGVTDWTPDGKSLIAMLFEKASPDLWQIPLAEGTARRPIVESRFSDIQGTVSPDGRWLAYSSSETGRAEVYVRAFPGPGGRWLVSSDGGVHPVWRGDGQELFYYDQGSNALHAVPITGDGALRVGTPEKLFDASLAQLRFSVHVYDATADGQRFILNVPITGNPKVRFDVVLNWTAGIER